MPLRLTSQIRYCQLDPSIIKLFIKILLNAFSENWSLPRRNPLFHRVFQSIISNSTIPYVIISWNSIKKNLPCQLVRSPKIHSIQDRQDNCKVHAFTAVLSWKDTAFLRGIWQIKLSIRRFWPWRSFSLDPNISSLSRLCRIPDGRWNEKMAPSSGERRLAKFRQIFWSQPGREMQA